MRQIIILIAFLVSTIGVTVQGQIYKNAIGVKAGSEYGLTLKHFVNKTTAVDFQILDRFNGYTINANLNLQKPINKYPELSYYYGAGAGYSIINSKGGAELMNKSDKMVAVNAVIGVEYIIKEVNISVALEYAPRLEVYKNETFINKFPIGLSIRYCIQ